MTSAQKHENYQAATLEINAILENETNVILKMATINCILKTHLPYYFWVGFYCVNNGELIIGPYQGTLGCLHIAYDRGVCGRAAREKMTQIVEDVHADVQHIACDSNSNSEIVVPVFNSTGDLIAVFDVDSTDLNAFDTIDQEYLESIMTKHFVETTLIMQYL